MLQRGHFGQLLLELTERIGDHLRGGWVRQVLLRDARLPEDLPPLVWQIVQLAGLREGEGDCHAPGLTCDGGGDGERLSAGSRNVQQHGGADSDAERRDGGCGRQAAEGRRLRLAEERIDARRRLRPTVEDTKDLAGGVPGAGRLL